ncbi:MAG: hypothetical protein K8F60_12345 [Melioribacteraceae bacterium]|nr:hypothetical protein [Melioribacteraceae bacterium]
MKKLILSTFVLLIILTTSCESPTEVIDNTQPGRRDYVWSVDTVKVEFDFLIKISGSGPNDIWAIGPGGGLDKTIWHFDGFTWSTDGISRGISPRSIFSFNKNDVWICGSDGKIWHYNGNNWKESLSYRFENYDVYFLEIWGESPNNIYAVGVATSDVIKKSVIFRYDGQNWKSNIFHDNNYQFFRIRKDINGNGKYYLVGYSRSAPSDEEYYSNVAIFEYDGESNLNIIYEAKKNLENAADVRNFNDKTYLRMGRKIYSDYPRKEILQDNEPNTGGQIWGRNGKDIFLRMQDGIAHYNGTDIEYIYRFENNHSISITDAVIFEKEIVFLAMDLQNNQNIILRGALE